MALSRSETMRVIEETGKYSAVVLGAINNPGDAFMAARLIDNDIRNLEKELRIARTARDYLDQCEESTRGTIAEEGSSNGRHTTEQGEASSTQVS